MQAFSAPSWGSAVELALVSRAGRFPAWRPERVLPSLLPTTFAAGLLRRRQAPVLGWCLGANAVVRAPLFPPALQTCTDSCPLVPQRHCALGLWFHLLSARVPVLSWELAATCCRRLSLRQLGWELEVSIVPGRMADWGLQGAGRVAVRAVLLVTCLSQQAMVAVSRA